MAISSPTSIYCRDGKIVTFVAHEYRRRVYTTFWSDRIFEDLARIAVRIGADGVYNFDMIVADNGNIYYLECNPRFSTRSILRCWQG
jgi:hypothetical protein